MIDVMTSVESATYRSPVVPGSWPSASCVSALSSSPWTLKSTSAAFVASPCNLSPFSMTIIHSPAKHDCPNHAVPTAASRDCRRYGLARWDGLCGIRQGSGVNFRYGFALVIDDGKCLAGCPDGRGCRDGIMEDIIPGNPLPQPRRLVISDKIAVKDSPGEVLL